MSGPSDENSHSDAGSPNDDATRPPNDGVAPASPARTASNREDSPEQSPPPVDRPSANGPARDESTGERPWLLYLYDIVSSVLIVIVIGMLLFTVSGVWPPLVAVESGSMNPHMTRGDLVFVMEEQRFPGPGASGDTGVVTSSVGARTDYQKFQQPGDVIVYRPGGNSRATPIIHRAMLWVNESENWYDDANPAFVQRYDDCEELPYCPAPHAGFITKGDNNVSNPVYDQSMRLSPPVKPEWVVGTAEVRIPFLGQIRLQTQAASVRGR